MKLIIDTTKTEELYEAYTVIAMLLHRADRGKVSLELSVIDMELSVRSINALRGAGIENLGQLITKSRAGLKKIDNLGARSIAEIEDILHTYGYQLQK